MIRLILALSLAPGLAHAQQAQLTPTRDGTLIETPDTNANGSGRQIYVGVTTTSGIRRGLVHFDVAGAIPAGAVVTAAHFDFEVESQGMAPSVQTWQLHPVLTDWGEGGSTAVGGTGAAAQSGDATWLCSFADGLGACTTSWLTPGGHFNGLGDGSVIVDQPGLYLVPSSPSMVLRVQGWLNAPATNHGWLIKSTDEVTVGSSKTVASRETASYAPPQLTVTYTLAGGTGSGTGTGTGGGGCGVDTDGDGVPELCDNCPGVYNPSQDDTDADTVGDACDLCPGNDLADANGDGRPDNLDTDLDGVADCVDLCPGGDDTVDTDGDGIADDCDNCPAVANPAQDDADGNGIGDACEVATPPTETGTGTGSGTATGAATGTGTGATTGTGTGATTGTGTGATTGTGTGAATGTGTGTGAGTGTGTGGDTGLGDDNKGCGCTTSTPPAGLFWLLPALLLVRRRD